AAHHDDRRQDRHREVGGLLQRVVLALMWMFSPPERIELDYFPGAMRVAPAWRQLAPLAAQIEKAEINEGVDDEDPHDREVPVPRAGEPSAECERGGYRLVLE